MLSLVGSSIADVQAPRNRIAQEIGAGAAVALRGTVSPLASARQDAGRLDSGTRISGMTLRLCQALS